MKELSIVTNDVIASQMLADPVGFDSEKYIALQSQAISNRRREIGGKLYLEMGGKLFDDMHASRVLPGFTPNNKIVMLQQLKDELEIMICLNAADLQEQKVRADLGITYEEESLRLIDEFRNLGFFVEHVVITQFSEDQHLAQAFSKRLQRNGLKVSHHRHIDGYPSMTEKIISPEGFGRNDHVQTTRDLVVVTAPGPGSGKLSTCLSQVYLDHAQGVTSGYAKFETFPIWNLPLEHPVNLAYEAATADLDDNNVIDPYHLAAYEKQVTSYNRDVEVFPLLKAILEHISGESVYKSPTDMGVNVVADCIVNDQVCREASIQEIIRRWYKARVDERKADTDDDTVSSRIRLVMTKAGITESVRSVIAPAQSIAKNTGQPGCAVQLRDGTIITGKTTPLLGCSAAMLLNALKHLAGIDDAVLLLRPEAIEPIQKLKTQFLGSNNPRLHTDEVLIALSVSASESEESRRAIAELPQLQGCDVHTTTILGSVDEGVFRSLGLQSTSEPEYQRKTLYQK